MTDVSFGAKRIVLQIAKDAVSEDTQKIVEDAVDKYVPNKAVAEALKLFVRSSKEYYTFCAAYGKSPGDAAAATLFLMKKGKHTLSFLAGVSESEALEIADAVANVALNMPDNLKLWRQGPYGVLLGFGRIFIDLLEVLYSVRAVQAWWYETFLKECSVTLRPIPPNPSKLRSGAVILPRG